MPNQPNNFIQIIKEALAFIGKKLDALTPKDSIEVGIKGIEVITLKGDKGEPGKDSTIQGPPGKDAHTPTDDELLALIKPLIPERAEDGKAPTETELLKLIRPLIPKVKDGETPSDARLLKLIKPLIPKKGEDGKSGIPGKDGSPDTGEEIIDKVNKDKSKKVIKKEKVEGLADIESMARTAEANSRYAYRVGGDTVYMTDLSSQTNGVTKTFTIPAFRRSIFVVCSDFPTILFPNNGFTAAGTTLLLTTDTAPSEGAQLGFMFVI